MPRRHLILLGSLVVAALVAVATASAGLPPPDTTIDSGPSGVTNSTSASFAFSSPEDPLVTYECALDGAGFSPCTSPPHTQTYTGLTDGSHTFRVRALLLGVLPDPDPASRSWTVDTMPPQISITITSDTFADVPSGANLTYSVSATDNTDPNPAIDCGASPASGTVVAVGQTVTITCEATDDAGNTDGDTETFTAEAAPDTTPPVVTPPASRTVEANGSSGALVNYEGPTAVDNVDGPLPPNLITCTKPSGSVFPLGATIVTCSATDNAGHTGSAAFTVTVVDTTPPVLTVPADLAIQSSSAVPASNSTIRDFLGAATASDIVDSGVEISHNAPATFPLGTTTVVFTAKDDAGNSTQKSAVVTITTQPVAPPAAADTTPPDNVRGVKAIAGNLSVAIAWRAPRAGDFHHVTITRAPGRNGAPETLVYRGKKKTFVARGLEDGVEYRFVIVAYDEAGNRAAGVAVVVFAEQQNLLVPVNGATISAPRRFAWRPVQGADYYNIQFWHDGKQLSAWPAKPKFTLPGSWRFEGKRHKLVPGTWLVYVWAGFGTKAEAKYGELHVDAAFVVRRR